MTTCTGILFVGVFFFLCCWNFFPFMILRNLYFRDYTGKTKSHLIPTGDETMVELASMLATETRMDTDAEVLLCNFFMKEIMDKPGFETLVSVPRLRTTIYLSKVALSVPGDYVETGVFTGGTSSIMMRMLMKYGSNKTFYAFDSFEGLPEPHRLDGDNTYGLKGEKGQFQSTQEVFVSNLIKWGAYNASILRVTKGFFSDTLPLSPVQHIAFLRADGDMFISTHDALKYLYHKIVPGGYIYIDDYGSFHGCRRAVDAFRSSHHIFEPIHYVREDQKLNRINFEAIWWRKRSS